MENHRVYVKTDKEGIEIRFRISFNKETHNWATSQQMEKGYRVNATPVEISRNSGYQTESFGAFTGFGDTLLACNRRSSKRYAEAIEILEERMLKYLAWFEAKGYNIDKDTKNELIEQQEHNDYRNHLILTGI